MHNSSPSSFSASGSFNNSSYSGPKGQQNFSRPPRREEFKAYVKNIPIDITKESVEALFSGCGNVVSCNVLEPKEGRNSTIGFVGFSSEEELNTAIQTMNGTMLGECQLGVDRAVQRDRNAGPSKRGGQENTSYQGKTNFQHSPGYQNGQPPFQGHRTEQYQQPNGSQHNYVQHPGGMPGVKVEQAIFNPRGPGRGLPVQSRGPNQAPGRDSHYMNGQGNPPQWTNQGPPHQWDQTNSVDNQQMSGQLPHGTMPQEPYNQQEQSGQFQNGPPQRANQGPPQWDQTNPVDNQQMSGQLPHGAMPQEPYNQQEQSGQFQNGPPQWTNQGPPQWDQTNSVDNQQMSGQLPHGAMPQEPYNQQEHSGQFQNGPGNPSQLTNQGPPQWDQTNSVDNQQMSGQLPHGAMPQEPYNQQEHSGQFQNGPGNPSQWTNQGPPQWDQTNSVDNQQMSGQLPHSTMPQEPYNQQEQSGQFQNGPPQGTNQGPPQWDQTNSADNQQTSGQLPHGTMPQEPYNQQEQSGQFQNGPPQWTNQGPPQWDQTNSVDNQQMSGQLPHGAMPQEPYNQQEQSGQFQNGPGNALSWSNQGPPQWNQSTGNSGDNHQMAMTGRLPQDAMPQEQNAPVQNGGQSCFKCDKVGHFARDCPTEGGEQRGRGGQNCHKCGEVGHFARDCPTQGEQRGNQRERGDKSCYKCGETGHISRECTSSGVLDKTCRKCGEEGHFARECPAVASGSSPGQKGDLSCHKCGETGHFARECPSSGGDENRPPPVTYIPPELPSNIDELFQDAPHSGLNFDKYDDIPVKVTGKHPVPPISTFQEAGILEQCAANIKKAQFTKPTPIQKYAIPIVLQGRDLMACAQTGSGKTVAFLVPVLTAMIKQGHLSGGFLSGETQAPSALCIAPTRELAMQIFKEACKFSDGSVVTAAVLYGGVSVQHQWEKLRRGCHILVATPGRLLDFVERNRVSLANVHYLILDEADRMLDMGFEPDIRKIVERCGMPDKTNRQTLMFSATFPDEIQRLASDFLKEDYLFVAVGRIGGSNLDISQAVITVPENDKQEKLFEILLNSGTDRTLIFVELKRVADFLACLLSQNNFPTTSISGDRTQQEREAALRDFRSGRAPVLVATSVAARGLDIPDVKHVINFDLPQDIEEYVHRIGRTGRIGNKGRATSFFQPGKDERLARSLVKVLSEAYQDVPEWLEQVAEEAIGSSYGPAGGKFASKDRREREHSRPSSSADLMGPVNRGMARLDVNTQNEPRPSQNSKPAAASCNEDDEDWD